MHVHIYVYISCIKFVYSFNFWGKVYHQYEMCAHILDFQKNL